MTDTGKRILFLQGLPGGSFWRLGQALRAQGCQVLRINFNGGDEADWREPAINFHGPSEDWPRFLAEVIDRHTVTDIVLFGDCRPLHRAASAVAAQHNVTVHVFEEGYVRPDWVTLELGGVNGHSPLPRDPDWYRLEAMSLPPVETLPALEQTFGRRARETFRYHAMAILNRWRYPNYRTHRPWGALTEGFGWLKRWARRGQSHKRSSQALQAIAGKPYFLFALQLDSDYQIRVHSPFDGMAPALELVITSFAKAAPADRYLVIKEHPLDNGLKDWRAVVDRCAAANGVTDRIVYCDLGDIDAMVRGSEGLVTVNSTTGTLGLAAGVPVVALGRAVYGMPGLTHQGHLDSFWSKGAPPDRDLYEAFRRVLADRCMVRGGFYSEEGLSLLVEGAVPRVVCGQFVASNFAVAAE